MLIEMDIKVFEAKVNDLKFEKQKLIDLCFQIGLMISTPGKDREDQPYDLTKLSTEGKAAWIAEQLRACGFDTEPCGASWGVLK